jgi:hypothetical protein
MAVLYLTGRVAKPVAEIYFDTPVYPFTRYGDGPAGEIQPKRSFENPIACWSCSTHSLTNFTPYMARDG